jgi:plasmid stabilization system protein ParE
MANYELAEGAEADLREIALYTLSEWGVKQASRYGAALEVHFQAIGNGKAKNRSFLQDRPELRVSKVEHHYVFYVNRQKECPLILAVLHVRMDLMARLRSRLEG